MKFKYKLTKGGVKIWDTEENQEGVPGNPGDVQQWRKEVEFVSSSVTNAKKSPRENLTGNAQNCVRLS